MVEAKTEEKKGDRDCWGDLVSGLGMQTRSLNNYLARFENLLCSGEKES